MIDRRLHVLRLVRQHGTVTAAAEALHLTPSAVSQQLRALARDLDVQLLQPSGRGVRLTEAAIIVLGHADGLHARWEQARAELDAHRRGERRTVRLCGFPSVLAALLGPVAERLRHEPPALDLEVVQADPSESLDLLVAGDVDLALLEAGPATPAGTDDRFEHRLLFTDPLQLVVPADHRLAERGSVALQEVATEPWVGGAPDGSYHGIVALVLRQAGLAPTFTHRALDWSAYLAVVGAGLGVALLPRLAVPVDGPVRALGLTDEPVPARRILTCVRRGSRRQPAIARLELALEAAAGPYRHDGR
jgi:DNA-binding transcriptional LysR family regulator